MSSMPAPEETVDWPILTGAALAVGLLLSGLAMKRQRLLARMQSTVHGVPMGGQVADVSVRQLMGLTLAFTLTQLPIEDVKLKLLAADGLRGWGALLACFEVDQQQIALSALRALLEGEAPLRAFHAQASWYDQLCEALPPLLHGSSRSLADPEVLLDAMWLGTALVTHPDFQHTARGDAWLWSRLLEEAAVALEVEPLAALPWCCVAAAAAEKREVAEAMLESDPIRQQLLAIARGFEEGSADGADGADGGGFAGGGADAGELRPLQTDDESLLGPPPQPGFFEKLLFGKSPSALQVLDRSQAFEAAYARAALHRLAVAADNADNAPPAERERDGDDDSPPPPSPLTRHVEHDELPPPSSPSQQPQQQRSPLQPQQLLHDLERLVAEHLLDAPPPLPASPPLDTTAVSREEKLLAATSSIFSCGVGGLLWGAARGALPSARARAPLRRSVLMATFGAMAFELAMQLRIETKTRLRGDEPGAPPLYRGSLGFAAATTLDTSASCALLWFLIQPSRCAFAFGGWVLGRGLYLGQQLLDLQIEFD